MGDRNTRLMLFTAVLFIVWPIFGYALVDFTPEVDPSLPTGITKADLLAAGFYWGDNVVTKNVTNNPPWDWKYFNLDDFSYEMAWEDIGDDFFCAVEEWWGLQWDPLDPFGNDGLQEQYIIDNWDSTYNWTWVRMTDSGTDADALFTIPTDSTNTPVYDNITQCINAHENVTVTIGRGIEELTGEADIWDSIWIFGNWYIEGLSSPFGGEYPAVIGIINYIIIIIGLVSIAVFFRGG